MRRNYEVWLGTQYLGRFEEVTSAIICAESNAKRSQNDISRYEIRIRMV